MQTDFAAFVNEIKKFNNVSLTAPAGADGDSVGTQCALKEILEYLIPGKKIRVINEEACPHRYEFLSGTNQFEIASEVIKKGKDQVPDLQICVDGGANRLGEQMTKLWKEAKGHGQVDHHAIGNSPGEYQFRLFDPAAASTTEIVYRFAKEHNVPMTKSLAQAIYVGLIFDTGLFKHSNTKPETMLIGSELLKVGFDHTATVGKALLMRSQGAFKMLQSTIQKAKFEWDGKVVWSCLDQKSFLEAGGGPDDREGLIDHLFLVEKCQIAVLYFERNPNQWKISFRSRGHDVARLAQSLSPLGGGHVLAAGCSLDGPQEQVIQLVQAAVKKVVNA